MTLAISSNVFAEWDTYQNDDSHTGYVVGPTSSLQPSVAWKQQLNATNLTGMAIGNGGVYVSNGTVQQIDNGVTSFFALNEATGAVSWTKSFSSTTPSWPLVFSINAPAYSDGSVYLQTSNNNLGTNLYSFNASTGATQFVAPFASQWETYLAPTPSNGNIYVDGGTFGGMYSFGAKTGTQNWFNSSLPQFDAWTPALSGGIAYAYVGSGLFATNVTTGGVQYTINDPNASPTYYSMNESVVLGADNDAFVTNNGRVVSYSLLSGGNNTPHIQWTNNDHFTGQVTLAQGVLYVADGSSLEALNELTGADLWSWKPTDGEAIDEPMIASDNELFVSTSTDVYAVDLATHTADWTVPDNGTLALSDHTLFIASPTGLVTALTVPEPPTALPAFFFLLLATHRAARRSSHVVLN